MRESTMATGELDGEVDESSNTVLRKRSAGIFVTKRMVAIHFLIVSIALVTVALTVYYFGVKCQSFDLTILEPIASTENPTTTANKTIVTDVRLPRHLRPLHYDIRLLPWMDDKNFTVDGSVQILVECFESTQKIVLHCADIEIDRKSVQILNAAKKEEFLEIDSFEEDAERQFFIIHLKSYHFLPGYRYLVSMNFTGILSDQHRGFYRASYTEHGKIKYVAMTQMEPVDARRAFPCFDEPSFKAEFSITLGRRRDMISLSNMPKTKTEPMNSVAGYEWDYFERSLPMSSYLVAMIIADYTYVESTITGNNITFRIWARHSAINQTKYALEMGPKMLTFFQEYFGINYPLPKQDMIALPDFPGAMENWGLITYGEQHLLYDPDMPSDFHREMVAQVIAHEQAHQWFGNLVTMEWWNDLWLNEGFASYLSYLGANHFEPKYRLCQHFVINEIQSVMAVDGFTTSHPVNQPVHHPDEISQIFDRISYNKGASVIRMLAEFLGHGTFQRGLSHYLKSRIYGNAVQDDLWDALTFQAEMDNVQLPTNIKTIMDSWTLKMGYPVVNVIRNYTFSTITVHQERFLLDSRSKNFTSRWWVPLTFSVEGNPEAATCQWIPEDSDTVVISTEANENQWVLFNVDQVGYYRVNYDIRNWNLIIDQLHTDPREFSVINRAQLIDDAFNLARADYLSYSILFNLTRYLRNESEYIPWKSAANGIKFLDAMLCRTHIYGAFQDYVIRMVDGLFRHAEYSRDSAQETSHDDPMRVYTQTIAWRLACHFQHSDCLQSAIKLYSDWMSHPKEQYVISFTKKFLSNHRFKIFNQPVQKKIVVSFFNDYHESIVPAHLKSIVACTAIAKGGKKEWEFAYAKFLSSNSAAEKDDVLEAMSCSNEVWILKRMLGWTLYGQNGPLAKMDTMHLLLHMVRNRLGRYLTFDFLKSHWDQVVKNYRSGIPAIANLLDIATESSNTKAELDQLNYFSNEKVREQSGLTSRNFEQLKERIEANMEWMDRNNATIILWLSEQVVDTTNSASKTISHLE